MIRTRTSYPTDLRRWWWVAWLGYTIVISIPFFVLQARANRAAGVAELSWLTSLGAILLFSLVLALPLYFRWKVWASCMTFFVIVGSFAMLRFGLPDGRFGSALGMVFFLWSLFLGFFLGGFFEAVSHLARFERFSSSARHGSLSKKNKRKK